MEGYENTKVTQGQVTYAFNSMNQKCVQIECELNSKLKWEKSWEEM